VVTQLVDEWLEDKDYFLVSVTVSPDDRIVIEIDHAEGVWIDDCVQLSRFVEEHLDQRKGGLTELEVGCGWIGTAFQGVATVCHPCGKGSGNADARRQKTARHTHGGRRKTVFRLEVERKVKPEGEKATPTGEGRTGPSDTRKIKYTKILNQL